MRLEVLLLALAPAAAVKTFMFRTCDQNPFCNRNRHYEQVAEQPDFTSPYSIAPSSVELSSATEVRAVIKKSVNGNAITFPFLVEVTGDDTVHLLIDEEGRKLDSQLVNSDRYSPASELILPQTGDPPKVAFETTEEHLSLTFGAHGENEVKVTFEPFSAVLSRNGEPQITVNSRSLLNIEHLRKQDSEGEWNPWESETGAWQDEFDSKKDNKLKGPESVSVDINFEGYTYVYGIPEHSESMSLRSTHGKNPGDLSDPYRLFNVDIFEYETNSPLPMYGSIPFMIAQKIGTTAGAFWLNSADTYVDIEKGENQVDTHWMSENGKFDLYLFVAQTPGEVLEAYGRLTGMAMLPQQFAIAYHQCRWNYNSEEDVLDVNARFDANDIPYDVIWLDIEYLDHKKFFTWNKDQFPDPERMLAELDKEKRKLVAIIDPHIKEESGYKVHDDIKAKSIAIMDAAGNPFHGHCWPGNSIWIDTFSDEGRKYWHSLFQKGTEVGGHAENIHIWNDMNEPSVFSGPETSGFKDMIHAGGWEHRDIHNFYGQTVVNATFDAMRDRYEGKQRPFILTRSYFAGSQRLCAMWTGDNQADWQFLQIATPMVLTSGLAGMPFAGADVGGFFGNPEPELLTRWYQTGAFYPFFRAHAHIDSRRREPYMADEPYNTTIADAIRLRYRLLPTFYTAFHDSSQTLAPVLRPLFYELPSDEETFALEKQFFLGESLMARPVDEPGVTEVDIYVPEDNIYYDYWTGEMVEGSGWQKFPVDLSTIPIFARGGTIHARKDRPRRSAELMQNDPYTLVVAVGKDGTAKGHIYVDDGISYDYEKGDYVTAEFSYAEGKLSSRVTHKGKSSFINVPIERVIVLGAELTSASVDGKQLEVISSGSGATIRNPRVPIGSDWVISASLA